jgi:hypothetical protein
VTERANLYEVLVNNLNIYNPYISSSDEEPEYYNGIKIHYGTMINQNIIRYSSFSDVSDLVNEGDFAPKQGWEYFWFATAELIEQAYGFDQSDTLVFGQDFVGRESWGNSRYLGTTASGLSASLWHINYLSYSYQRVKPNQEWDLGYYYVGSAPYKEISSRNGRFEPEYRWEDRDDGLYKLKDEGYNFIPYVEQVAQLEYQKLLNINGQILPYTSGDINLTLDAYYYYDIGLLTRINIGNTTQANVYTNNNGFPIAVKSINISSANMEVILTCDNAKTASEIEEIDDQYPDEEDYIYPLVETKQHSKYDPNRGSYVS